MSRVYNFSAGPAVLPEEVLKSCQSDMLDYHGSGMSVMEMSHRSAVFQGIIDEAEADLRDLLAIPDNYKVLFLNGSANHQFAAVCMNLMKNKVADYIITGQWAKKAYAEAQKYGTANAVASSADETFSYIPDCSDLPIDDDADYVYICENNTRPCPTPRARTWWQTSPAATCRSRWTSPSTASSTAACRRTSAPRA